MITRIFTIIGCVVVAWLHTSEACAQSSAERCQVLKLEALAPLVRCTHNALFLPSQSERQRSTAACERVFRLKWSKLTTGSSGQSLRCSTLGTPRQEFNQFLRAHLDDLLALLESETSQPRSQRRMCRSKKAAVSGQYIACLLSAEADFAFPSRGARYERAATRCTIALSSSWQRIHQIRVQNRQVCSQDMYPLPTTTMVLDAVIEALTRAIRQSDGFATPTPTPNPTATPSPTSTPILTPTPTLTSTPTPTLTPTATSTPPPTSTPTPAPVCGNGVVESGEVCDDNNDSNTDACLTNCLPASCGDSFVQTGVEACDDGNGSNTDACLSTCMAASCGDGFVRAGIEQCDDGNSANTDACVNTCSAAFCGDGFVWSGLEDCDDGNTVNGDGCDNTCTP